jgi:hypothetical protein
LQHFALGDGRRRRRQDLQNPQRPVGHHELKRAGEQEIADENGCLVAEHRVGTGEAAAELAFVHHVVVQQRRGVDELDAGGEVDVPHAAAVAAHARGRQRQHRPQPLAAGGDDVGGQLRDQRDGAVHARDDGAVAFLKVVVHLRHQVGQRVLAGHGPSAGRCGDEVGHGFSRLAARAWNGLGGQAGS